MLYLSCYGTVKRPLSAKCPQNRWIWGHKREVKYFHSTREIWTREEGHLTCYRYSITCLSRLQVLPTFLFWVEARVKLPEMIGAKWCKKSNYTLNPLKKKYVFASSRLKPDIIQLLFIQTYTVILNYIW